MSGPARRGVPFEKNLTVDILKNYVIAVISDELV